MAGSQLAVVPRYGIGALGVDSERYLTGASRLLADQPLEGLQRWYAGYVALVALCQSTSLGVAGLVALQFIAAAVAVAGIYKLGRALGNRRTGILAAGVFAVNPDLARWNLFVLTDSLYISLLPLAALAIWKGRSGTVAWLSLALAGSTFLALLRPSGWLLLPVAAVFWVLEAPLAQAWKGAAVVSILTVFSGWVLMSGEGATAGREPYVLLQRGEVIWGYTAGRLEMPAASSDQGGVWRTTLFYVMDHPLASARLAATRLIYELGHVRPFYSFLHNAFCLLLLPVYALAVLGFRASQTHPLTTLLSMIIGSQLFLVAGVCADWDGRYLLHVLPLIGVLAARGATGGPGGS